MKLPLIITSRGKENFLSDDYYEISYNLLIMHALQSYMSHFKNQIPNSEYIEDIDEDAFLTIDALKDNCSQLLPLYIPNFLEVYPFEMGENKKGMVIIDRTSGCFPLALYPNDNDPTHGNRISAFNRALQSIFTNLGVVLPLIKETSWSKELEKKLCSILYPSDFKNNYRLSI